MSDIKVGWAGLGNMGNPIVKNILKAGYPVTVYNRTKSKEQEALSAGASSAETPVKLVEASDVIFVMVSDDNAVKEIFTGADGLLSANAEGKLFINVSTVAPQTSKYVDEQCRAKGASFLDVPVSGSVKPAQDATLILMVGGDAEYYEKAKPILDVIGKLSIHVGPVGAGSAAKLAINYLLGLNLQGLAETVLFAEANGVSTENMLTIINEGAVGNGITKMKSDPIMKNQFPAAFALKYLAKDLRLAREQGIDMPLSAPLSDTFQQALNSGMGDEDVMAVIKYLKR
ncbi:NAD(P)-dependent oxidoreductase [Mucilaginibacter sp. KACC 22063]|uniref:NAD(P)-dependent oxidoreductase n=1 Tax=Mucilaginibacter sp. KACC 22063 TaxID=3025666 RepID=UPI002366360C|nr:NAD(P)-dependent oxidoreductase [Mucilaginibacter sp. KACC 22063]WDF56421.1 NAD(P)-dependent oxidoreductase [Mucilaginibacter sp. KACC 22063]